MFKPRTFIELCYAMQTRAVVTIDNTTGVINNIGIEDGSGRCWIVSLVGADSEVHNVFFREGTAIR